LPAATAPVPSGDVAPAAVDARGAAKVHSGQAALWVAPLLAVVGSLALLAWLLFLGGRELSSVWGRGGRP
jgi:hypothetical protein